VNAEKAMATALPRAEIPMYGLVSMATAARTKQPQELTEPEKTRAKWLGIGGVVLVLLTVGLYGVSHKGAKAGVFVTKVTTTTEPKTGPKTTTTTEYGESIVLFALTIGAAMFLCAAFYGRIREIKVEGIDISLDPTEVEAVEKGVKAATKDSGDKAAEVEPLAKAVAHERASQAIATSARGLPADKLEALGKEAAEDILGLLS
jgi:hypothetical protein